MNSFANMKPNNFLTFKAFGIFVHILKCLQKTTIYFFWLYFQDPYKFRNCPPFEIVASRKLCIIYPSRLFCLMISGKYVYYETLINETVKMLIIWTCSIWLGFVSAVCGHCIRHGNRGLFCSSSRPHLKRIIVLETKALNFFFLQCFIKNKYVQEK